MKKLLELQMTMAGIMAEAAAGRLELQRPHNAFMAGLKQDMKTAIEEMDHPQPVTVTIAL